MLTLLSYIVAYAPEALARSPYFNVYCNALGTYCGDGQVYLIHLANRVRDVFVIPLIGGLAVMSLIVGGIKLIASAGNDQGKEEAKKLIQYGLIGISLALLGIVIVKFVCDFVASVRPEAQVYCTY